MKLKTIDRNGKITLREYADEDCKVILEEASYYRIEETRFHGEDYGGSQKQEDKEVTYAEVIPERILVRNRHFCGVCIQTVFEYSGNEPEYRDVIQYISAEEGCSETAKSGYMFSNDDHDRWDYTYFSLVPESDVVEEL